MNLMRIETSEPSLVFFIDIGTNGVIELAHNNGGYYNVVLKSYIDFYTTPFSMISLKEGFRLNDDIDIEPQSFDAAASQVMNFITQII